MPSQDLVDALMRFTDARTGSGAFRTCMDGVDVLRSDHVRPPVRRLSRPVVCFVAQGAKQCEIGGDLFEIGAGRALLVGVDVQSIGRVSEASPERPFLGLAVDLDPLVMREVAERLDPRPEPTGGEGRGVVLVDVGGALGDCIARLVALLDDPRAAATLRSVIMREMCYWLLAGPTGAGVAALTLAGSHPHRVVDAVHALRERFAEPVRSGELASIAQMSPSAFHRHFKALTSLTPLQFQKRLRLLEARRLLLSEAVKIETAAFEVGYQSASQFSREYSRMFGSAPRLDVRQFGAAG